MSVKSYENFDLLFDEKEDGSYRVRVINSPAGQASGTFEMPLSSAEIESFILGIGKSRGKVRSIDVSSINIPSVQEFGERLYSALFSGDVSECFRRSYAKVKEQKKGLRVRLRLSDAPSLIDIPWEFLYDKLQRRYIGLSTNSPIVRYLDLANNTETLFVEGALRVLVMISSPDDYPPLDVEREWMKIQEATAELQESGHIIIDRLEDASLLKLQQALHEQDYHIFHFIGHGGFDSKENDGVLVLEDENGNGKAVKGDYLGMLLYDEDTTQLAILNACNGARTSVSDPFAGVGQSLLQQGVPAVIAMQFEITDQAAITFSKAFYSALARAHPIDAAMTVSRKAIFANNNEVEWATPVLYMNTDNAAIFDKQVSDTNNREDCYAEKNNHPDKKIQGLLSSDLLEYNEKSYMQENIDISKNKITMLMTMIVLSLFIGVFFIDHNFFEKGVLVGVSIFGVVASWLTSLFIKDNKLKPTGKVIAGFLGAFLAFSIMDVTYYFSNPILFHEIIILLASTSIGSIVVTYISGKIINKLYTK